MYTGPHFPFREVLSWTRRDIIRHLLMASVVTGAYANGWTWLAIPWLPIALLGTAVSFIVGFKNNASYDRLWEARRVWGAIVNGSRAWGLMARDYVSDLHAREPVDSDQLDAARRTLYRRHVGWLTALRYQLRQSRSWEGTSKVHNVEYRRRWFRVDEHENDLVSVLAGYLPADEHALVVATGNRAAQILALQSRHLAELRRAGWIDDFRHMELERVLTQLLAQQGASERIKNFPYPRQYATMNLWFVNLFVTLIPFGLLQEFEKLGGALVWLLVPFSALAAWIFTTMEKVGESTENPFEGSANDVPITAMSRGIEIDLWQMLGETALPPAIVADHDILT